MNEQERRAVLGGRPRTRLCAKPECEEVALPEEGEEGGAVLQGPGGGAGSPGSAKAEEERGVLSFFTASLFLFLSFLSKLSLLIARRQNLFLS